LSDIRKYPNTGYLIGYPIPKTAGYPVCLISGKIRYPASAEYGYMARYPVPKKPDIWSA